MTAISAILFDADEVIQYPEAKRIEQLVPIFGFVPEPVAQFIADLHAAEDTTLTGVLDFLPVLRALLAHWGLPDRARELREWLNIVTVDQDVLGVVSRLRQSGYCCALATNQQQNRAQFMANDLEYAARFDHSFFSCDLGLAKPDPDYFRAILAALRIEPGQALFIDDKPQNAEGARSVGIRAECFVNSRNARAHLDLAKLLDRFGVTFRGEPP